MSYVLLIAHIVVVLGLGTRILLRDDMRPDVRMGWLVVLVLLPYASAVLYLLFGEVALSRGGKRKRLGVQAFMLRHRATQDQAEHVHNTMAPHSIWQPAFACAQSVNGFAVQAQQQVQLLDDGNQARAQLLKDLEAAQNYIHLLYYIWLDDQTGRAVAHALIRAVQRGVQCRVIVDGLGSRALVHSALWKEMQAAGVQTAIDLSLQHWWRVMLTSRIDLRNHRKLSLIDGRIAYCGSQNCADAAFLPKARYAPWVDVLVRLQGSLVQQLEWVFASDWSQCADLPWLPQTSPAPVEPECRNDNEGDVWAVTVAEGPTERARTTSQLVSTLLANARHSVGITTPYFVPDATVLDALACAALRGVRVQLTVPARNDSWIVGAASRSSYRRLLLAGVEIAEFQDGLLHAKTLCVDSEVVLVGSTNLDLRSFDINLENNLLLHSPRLAHEFATLQAHYRTRSKAVTLHEVQAWSWSKRIWNHLWAMLSPIL